jgi:hypothetical protein
MTELDGRTLGLMLRGVTRRDDKTMKDLGLDGDTVTAVAVSLYGDAQLRATWLAGLEFGLRVGLQVAKEETPVALNEEEAKLVIDVCSAVLNSAGQGLEARAQELDGLRARLAARLG